MRVGASRRDYVVIVDSMGCLRGLRSSLALGMAICIVSYQYQPTLISGSFHTIHMLEKVL